MSRAVAFALVLATGCAVTFQERPATDGHASTCQPSKLWIADAVGVAAGVAAVVVGAVVVGNNNGNAIAGAGAVGGIVYGASMGNGLSWNRQCHAG